jgi:PAS domain S-box-containing protein
VAEVEGVGAALGGAREALEQKLRDRIATLEKKLQERENVEAQLRSANERLSSTIELLPDATFMVDCDQKVIAWNHAAEKLTGLEKRDVLGQGDHVYAIPFFGTRQPCLIDLVDSVDPNLEASYKFVRREGGKVFGESYFPRLNDGKGAHLWGVAAPLFDTEGHRFGTIEVVRDLTELRRTEQDLEKSISLMRAVLDAVADGIVAVDGACRIQCFNRKFVDLWGLPESAFQGAPIQSLAPRLKDPERFVALIEGLEASAEPSRRGTLELLDGRIFEHQSLPQRVGEARIGRVWSFREVTDQVRSVKTLLRSEETFKVAFFGMSDLAAISDFETGRLIEVNDSCERVLGWSRDEILGRAAAGLSIWPSQAERSRVIHQLEKIGEIPGGEIPEMEFEVLRKDGGPNVVSGSARLVEMGGRKRILLILRDVTERRRFEEDLRNLNVDLERRVRERTEALEREVLEHRRARDSLGLSEHKYRELVESANSIILRWDTAGRITFLNEFGQSFFGFCEDEILGRHVVGTIVPPSESNGRDLVELMARISAHPEQFVINENENTSRSGERVWIAWTNRPVLDAEGRLVEILSVGNDITQLKKVERELVHAKEAAESADRLKSAFLATMSHELRTPLNSIIGFTGILLQGLAGPLNDEQTKQLGMVQHSARHLHALINDVLDLSKIEAGQLKLDRAPFDYRASATDVLRQMEPLAKKKGLALNLELAPEVGMIVSDRRRVEQVLVNLLSNAIKFTDEGVVEVTCAVRDGQVETSVRDSGIGIKPEDCSVLFRPFQQVDVGLTRRHEGTGLGLSICRKLLDLLGGTITFSSTFGAGSVFTFQLPLGEAS